MPEEINRIVADEFSDYLFIHSDEARANLQAEGIALERIHFVGNTMIDTLVAMEERFRGLRAAARLGLSAGDYLLVTLHRPALVDGPMLHEALTQLASVARELPVVFPMHPRTRKMVEGIGARTRRCACSNLWAISEFLSLEADAAGVLTDSGGVQEETTFLGVPCFTLRDNTERPVTLRAGTNTLLGLDPVASRRFPRRSPGRPGERTAAAGLGWSCRRAARRGDLRRACMRRRRDAPARR